MLVREPSVGGGAGQRSGRPVQRDGGQRQRRAAGTV